MSKIKNAYEEVKNNLLAYENNLIKCGRHARSSLEIDHVECIDKYQLHTKKERNKLGNLMYDAQVASDLVRDRQFPFPKQNIIDDNSVQNTKVTRNVGDKYKYDIVRRNHSLAEKSSRTKDVMLSDKTQQEGAVHKLMLREQLDQQETTKQQSASLDEETAILYAKLSEDGLEEMSKLSNKQCQYIEAGCTAEVINNEFEMSGYITPTNTAASEADDTIQIGINAEKDVISEPEPDEMPHDADFNNLIDAVLHVLADVPFEEMLPIFHGTCILEEGLLLGLTTPSQLLDLLVRWRFISRDNLYLLQAIVWKLDNSDLYSNAIEYIRHRHHVIHFYPALEITPRGFNTIQCHFSSNDFTRLTRDDLDLIRLQLTNQVFLSIQNAYIVGIQLGERVSIALMLPDRYVQEIADMTAHGLIRLACVGIDDITVYGRTFATVGNDMELTKGNNYHAKVVPVYQQLHEKAKLVEERDHEIHELREEAEFMQLEIDTMRAEMQMLSNRILHESNATYESNTRGSSASKRSFLKISEDIDCIKPFDSKFSKSQEGMKNPDVYAAEYSHKVSPINELRCETSFTNTHQNEKIPDKYIGRNESFANAPARLSYASTFNNGRDVLMAEIQYIVDELAAFV